MKETGVIRQLTGTDKCSVANLCNRAMPNDFVPLYFDNFIENGIGLAFEKKQKVVGIILISQRVPGEGWLFGLRVDPNHRQKGIGRALTVRGMKALSTSCHTVRVGIFPGNRASFHLVKSLGFSACAEYLFRVFEGEPSSFKKIAMEPATTSEKDVILHALTSDERLRKNKLLIPRSFEWYTLSEKTLTDLIRNRCVWRIQEQLAIVSVSDEPEPWVEIEYLSQPFDHILPALLQRFVSHGTLEAALPAKVGFEERLENYGFVIPTWGSRITILERSLPYHSPNDEIQPPRDAINFRTERSSSRLPMRQRYQAQSSSQSVL